MPVTLNHTIVNVRDKRVSAKFYADLLGLPEPVPGPAKKLTGQHNTHFGGRGVYWEDPDGHFLEIITRPYAL